MTNPIPIALADAPSDEVWRALADPTRRRILDLLREGPRITGAIASEFSISRIAVMRHLEVLTSAGLVTNRKRGRERWHYVNLVPLVGLADRWASPAAATWTRGLLRLRNRVEASPMSESPDRPTGKAIDIALDIRIEGSPSRVFEAITSDPGAWWGHPYLRPEATALAMEPVLAGKFIEQWSGGSALIATVTAVEPDRLLQLTGSFHLGVAVAIAEFVLTPDGNATELRFSFGAIGAIDEEVASGFNLGWRDLLTERLKQFVEQGIRLGVEPGDD